MYCIVCITFPVPVHVNLLKRQSLEIFHAMLIPALFACEANLWVDESIVCISVTFLLQINKPLKGPVARDFQSRDFFLKQVYPSL
jgi:hypothetical protein